MIAYLEGTLLAKEGDQALVVAGGVGYELRLPAPAVESLGPIGSRAELWVHTSVKEDAIDLYGFDSARQRTLFRLLLEVPKVGPALALLLMSALSPGQLAQTVQKGDLAAFTRVKGIGKKTAEALLFHLKDRVLAISATAEDGVPFRAASDAAPRRADQLVAALLSLGYKPAQAEAAAASAREQMPTGGLEELLREGLKILRQS